MNLKKRDESRVKSNFLRRRRVAQAANDAGRGVRDQGQDTERRGMPNVPTPRRRRV
jgi:hypothetical protein